MSFWLHEILEVVYVGIVNFLHYKMVMASLEAGKHVLCEKPLGMNVREVKGRASSEL